jgi:hypothetical protein
VAFGIAVAAGAVAAGVAVGATVGVAAGAAGVGVAAGVAVAAGVSVAAGMAVAAGVAVAAGGAVAASAGVTASVGVATGDAVSEGGVAVADPNVTTRSGGCADSRLPKLMAVALLSVSARLTSPFPATREVTFTLTVEPAVTGPEATEAVPKAGALEAVVLVSLHVVLETACAEMPAPFVELAYSLSTAWLIVPLEPLMSKRRYATARGEPSTRRVAVVP